MMDAYALKWAKAHGWGDFHGAANSGIGSFEGIGRGAGRFNTNLSPSPLQTAGATVTINHDTDINIFGNADKAAQTAIVNSQYDLYSQAVRNNLPRTR